MLAAEMLLGTLSYTLAVWTLAENGEAFMEWECADGDVGDGSCLGRLAASLSAGLYRRSLRYASLADLISIIKVATASSIGVCALVWWRFPDLRVPAAVFMVDWAFLLLFWGGLHFGARVLKTQQAVWRTAGKRVVIVGAGDAGMSLLKELALDPSSGCSPMAVVDDDGEMWGRTIYDVPVLSGGIAKLSAAVAMTKAEEILICIPSASVAQMREILRACRQAGVGFAPTFDR